MNQESEKNVLKGWVSKYVTHKLLFNLIYFMFSGLFIGIGIWLSNFALIVIGLISPCRRLGWALSKSFLYRAMLLITLVTLLMWGVATAFGIHELIIWLHPNLFIKIMFGWGAGAYVSIPNFGLFNEQAIPTDAKPRHTLIEVLPFITYVIASMVFIWFFPTN